MSDLINHYHAKAKSSWPNAKMHSRNTSLPASLYLDERFRTVRGSTSANWNNPMFSRIEKDLFQESQPSMAFEMANAHVFGCGFLVATDIGFAQQSRYLATNIEKRIINSLRDPIIELGDEFPWIMASNASQKNYWHWFAQVLPAVMQSRDLLLKSGHTKFGLLTHQLTRWQRESLELLDVGAVKTVEITVFQSARAGAVVYSDLLGARHPYTPSIYRQQVRQQLISKLGQVDIGRKICVSRKDTKNRPIINETELHETLEDVGFEILTATGMTVLDQIRAFHSADVVVAPHGAGSTNILFCRPGSKVLELSQAGHPNAGPASLCKTSGAELWIDVYPDDGKGPATEGWSIDIEACLETLDRMGCSSTPTV